MTYSSGGEGGEERMETEAKRQKETKLWRKRGVVISVFSRFISLNISAPLGSSFSIPVSSAGDSSSRSSHRVKDERSVSAAAHPGEHLSQ